MKQPKILRKEYSSDDEKIGKVTPGIANNSKPIKKDKDIKFVKKKDSNSKALSRNNTDIKTRNTLKKEAILASITPS